MKSNFFAGFNSRLDRSFRLHHWSMLLYRVEDGEPIATYRGSLPKRLRYFQHTVDPQFGDLQELGPSLFEQVPNILLDLFRDEAPTVTVHASRTHSGSGLLNALVWSGINLEFHDIPDPDISMLKDHFRVGGHAGHELTHLYSRLAPEHIRN